MVWFGFIDWFGLVLLVGFVGWFGLVRLLWLVWTVFLFGRSVDWSVNLSLLLPNVRALHQLQYSPISLVIELVFKHLHVFQLVAVCTSKNYMMTWSLASSKLTFDDVISIDEKLHVLAK